MYSNPFTKDMTYPEASYLFFSIVDSFIGKPELEQLKADFKEIVTIATKREAENTGYFMTNDMV